MGLHGPHSRIWWIQNELSATASMRPTKIQPTVRWGMVPAGAEVAHGNGAGREVVAAERAVGPRGPALLHGQRQPAVAIRAAPHPRIDAGKFRRAVVDLHALRTASLEVERHAPERRRLAAR